MARYPTYLRDYYFRTWTHLPQFLVGILLGWLINDADQKLGSLRPRTVGTFWTASLTSIIAVVYGLVPYLDEQSVPEIPSLVRVAYGSLHQVVWSLAVGWIILACCVRRGGLADAFLSCRIFVPLARLSYGVFLVHYNLIRLYYTGLYRTPRYYRLLDVAVMDYLAILTLSLALSFVLCLTVEMPSLNLMMLMLDSRKTKLIVVAGRPDGCLKSQKDDGYIVGPLQCKDAV